MTIEEKAKAYDEALERARLLNADNMLSDEAIEEIFPQLAESEDKDERIRKAIQIALSLNEAKGYLRSWGISYEQADAWLEKQKEQKPVHTAKEIWEEMRLEVYAQASGNRHEPNCSDDSTKMFSLRDIDEIFEKIGNATIGSRPAEWSEEDEDTYNQVYYLFRDARDEWYKAIFSGCYPKITRDKVLAMLKSLRPQPQWKPSKEQMEAMESAVKLYKQTHFEMYHERIESLYEQLKKLM